MPDQIHSYVDEAGDPTLFGSKRGSGVIVGNDGCSKFFIMGKQKVADPESLSQKLTHLRPLRQFRPSPRQLAGRTGDRQRRAAGKRTGGLR